MGHSVRRNETEVEMESSADQPEDWVQALMRDYQDKLVSGLYETIYGVEASCLDALMEGQARSCVTAFVELTDLATPMDLDSFLDAIRTAGPSQVDIRREGAVIHWTERHRGECVCPFVRRQVIRLDPKLCICGAYWVKHLFRTVANTEVKVETVETAATGAENCCFRITLKDRAGTADDG
jgi:hypothetical protein